MKEAACFIQEVDKASAAEYRAVLQKKFACVKCADGIVLPVRAEHAVEEREGGVPVKCRLLKRMVVKDQAVIKAAVRPVAVENTGFKDVVIENAAGIDCQGGIHVAGSGRAAADRDAVLVKRLAGSVAGKALSAVVDGDAVGINCTAGGLRSVEPVVPGVDHREIPDRDIIPCDIESRWTLKKVEFERFAEALSPAIAV